MLMGIDLAFNNVGFVVVNPDGLDMVSWGCIKTKRMPKKKRTSVTVDDIRRIELIANELTGIIEEHKVVAIAAELGTGGTQSAISTKALGMATATLVTLANALNVPLYPYTPTQVKKAVGSRTYASKDTLARVVEDRWPVLQSWKHKTTKEHVTDAAAVILAAKTSDIYHKLFLEAAYKRVVLEKGNA